MGRAPRTLSIAVLGFALALVLSGCVTISATSSNQPQSMGTINLGVSVCASGAPGCNGPSNNGSAYSFLNETMSDETFTVQVLVAVRLPEGAVAPENLTGQLAGGGTLAFARSASYEAELTSLEPPPAGERWWGWLSAGYTYGRNAKQAYSVVIAVTPPAPAGEGPLPSPMRWRPVAGARFSEIPARPVTRPVECGTTNAHLYQGYGEDGASNASVVCIDSPTPDAARGFLEAPLVDFGIVGTTLQAPAGSTVTGTFLAKRSGVADPATTFTLAATGGPPGSTVTLDRTSVPLGGDSTVPVLATVTIPPGTPAGTYPVTLTGTAPGKPSRAGVLSVVVAEPTPAPVPGPGPGTTPVTTDTVKPVISAASLTRRRFRVGAKPTALSAATRTAAGTTLAVRLSEAATLTAVVERLRPGRRSGSRCTVTAKRGKRCTVVKKAGTLERRLPAGASRIAFSGRLGSRKLAPGTYRLTLVATDAAGNRSASRTLRFTIVRR